MLYIRTDMNDIIATGHVMRCLAVADAAAGLGEDTTFILSDEHAVCLVEDRGYHAVVLHTQWDHMETEAGALSRVIREHKIKAMLIDSYMVTQRYLEMLSEMVQVAYIDDLNAFLYPVHTLVCYAGYYKKFCYEKRYRGTKLLLGTQYVPLGKPFQNMGRKTIRQPMGNLLLLSGGTDRFGILEGMLGKINPALYTNIDVICGRYYTGYEQLQEKYRSSSNVHFHKAVTNMEHYMVQADAAVSAGGTSLYELCACGTPAVCYSFADNQLDNVQQFQDDGLMDYAGDVRYTDIFERTARLLEMYACSPKLRQDRSNRMQKLVDGKGAGKIAAALIEMQKS